MIFFIFILKQLSIKMNYEELLNSHKYKIEARGNIRILRREDEYEMHEIVNKQDDGSHFSYKKYKKDSPRNRNSEYYWQININDDTEEIRRKFRKGEVWNNKQCFYEYRESFRHKKRNYWIITKPAKERKSSLWRQNVEIAIEKSEEMRKDHADITEYREKSDKKNRKRVSREWEEEDYIGFIYPAPKKQKLDYGF